ncbi:MAG: hypothetical protein AB7K36_29240, partial [Chloroflexota bacterium]
CSGIPDGRLQVELVKATIEHGNAAWSAGVGRQGTADRYSAYFAGRWLDDLTTEVAALRSARQVREARLDALEFTSVQLVDDESATAETIENWQDRTVAEDGSLVRDASGRLRQHYDLRLIDGLWKIVDAHIVRE